MTARSIAPVWAVALLACTNIPAFECTEDYQCVVGGKAGRCEKNRICSFQSESCPSNRRYAPQGNAEGCVPVEPPCTVAGLAAGANFTCAVFSNGRVSCWGEGASGQLGASAPGSFRSTPQKIDMLAGVVEVAGGAAHACALHDDGAVSCWGDNGSRQLGDGTSMSRSRPVTVAGVGGVASLAVGGRHGCALRTDGSLHCWGRNDRGQLGDGTTTMRSTPTRIATLRNEVVAAAAGDSHTCAILRDGSTSCWGQNRSGAVAADMTTMVLAPTPVVAAPGAVVVGAGDSQSCVIDASGALVCWGLNDVGQLGDRALGRILAPTPIAGVEAVASFTGGGAHACAVARDGVASCWGSGTAGQLGRGSFQDGAPAPVGAAVWKKLAAGLRHTCGLTVTGEVFCWGRGGEGQLGDGIALAVPLPEPTKPFGLAKEIASGSAHTCALTRAGAVWCWGRGEVGQLGSETRGSSEPLLVDLPAAAQIAAAGDQTCARLMADGSVHCWGRGNRGQLGDGTTVDHRAQPRPVALPEAARHVAVGLEHACAVTVSGAAYCWGETEHGRLGNAAIAAGVQNRPIAVAVGAAVVSLSAGEAHTCAVVKGGTVFCWGQTTYGQSGVAVSATPSPPVRVPSLVEVTAVAAGTDHTCALTMNGSVWCWGRGDSSQLGYGTTASGAGAAQPVQVPSIDGVVALAAGGSNTCGLRTDGNLRCWGANSRGQLGSGDYNGRTASHTVKNIVGVSAIDVGDRHVCAVQTDGTTQCWGSNQYGQLGNGIVLEVAEPKAVALTCP